MIFYEVKSKKDGKVIISNMAGFANADRFLLNRNTKISNISAISRVFEMTSRHIEDHEWNSIFEDGYSGKHAAGKSGNGIGMFYTKKALNKIGLDICVDKVIGTYTSGDIYYSTNTFKIFNTV